jgi:hypothetical protein
VVITVVYGAHKGGLQKKSIHTAHALAETKEVKNSTFNCVRYNKVVELFSTLAAALARSHQPWSEHQDVSMEYSVADILIY